MARRLGLVLLGVLALAPPAQAKLRSPHLETSCANGFSYGEITAGNWRVEGCHKTGTPQAGEQERTLFKGDVELNGMLVEGSKNLLVTKGIRTTDGFQHHFARVTRDDGKLVLDPKIGGQRRRLVLFTGDVDLELLGVGLKTETDAIIADAGIAGTTVDIPVGSDAKILGMRVGGKIHDATVSGTQQGGVIKLKPRLRMGETASALLRNWEANVKVQTVDGTGMKISGLTFAIPNIEIPGIGGFKNLHVEYDGAHDEWSGGVDIDLGDLFPSIAFDMAISASTGAPTKIQVDVQPLNIALGPTGIFLQELRGGFATNPLVLNSGIGLSAGPEFGGVGLVDLDGNIEVTLEPSFRMENTGTVRLFPLGANSQIASGTGHVILDSRGYLSIGGNAGFQETVLGIGAAANLSGNGAYATVNNKFDIDAQATGSILLGDLGSFDIVHFAATTSSNGWGVCGHLLLFLNAGVGQQWDHNPKVILSCDLSQFEANVPDPAGRSTGIAPRATGDRARTFVVAKDTKQLAVEIQGDAADPRTVLFGPTGDPVAGTATTGPLRTVNNDTIVAAPTGSAVQHIFLRNPAAGQYTLRWDDQGGQVIGMRFARDLVPLSAKVAVSRGSQSGRRRLSVSAIKGLGEGDQLAVGVRTPNGVMPIADMGRAGTNEADFREVANGTHDIVGSKIRDGIPLPGSAVVLGTYTATLPPPPRALNMQPLDTGYSALAKPQKGAELPDAWQYVARSHGRIFDLDRAKPGTHVTITVPEGYHDAVVKVHGVVDGKVLTKVFTKHL